MVLPLHVPAQGPLDSLGSCRETALFSFLADKHPDTAAFHWVMAGNQVEACTSH